MRIGVLLALAAALSWGSDRIETFGRTWAVPFASDWKVESGQGTPILTLMQGREPLPGPRRPFNFALTDPGPYGRLTIEAEMMATTRSFIVVFAYRDEAHFDYAHLSTDTAAQQPVHNGIFHVYGGERVRISSEAGPAALAEIGRWYRVKLEHDARSGSVRVTVDGREVPALTAVDMSLGAGKIGLGSFNETARFRGVRITVEPVTAAPVKR